MRHFVNVFSTESAFHKCELFFHCPLHRVHVRMNAGNAEHLAHHSPLQTRAISIFSFGQLNITYEHSAFIC